MAAGDQPATAARVVAALAARHARHKGWATFTEVTMPGTSRRADALALNVWTNSRDFQLHGFEVKVSRGDWLSGLKNPEKSAYFRDRCTYWWIAAGPGIVQRDELPPRWGLLVLHGGALWMEKTAERLEGQGIDQDLLLVLLRHAYDASPSQELPAEARRRSLAEGEKRANESASWSQKAAQQRLSDDYAAWVKIRDGFERESGVHITTVNAKTAGRAYGFVYRSKDRERAALAELEAAGRRLDLLRKQHARSVADARKALGEVDA